MRLIHAAAVAAASLALCAPRAARAEEHTPDASHASGPTVVVKTSAGGTTRALYDVLIAGGEADVAVGVDSASGSYGLYAGVLAGTLDGGLAFGHAVFGVDLAWSLGVVRLGARPRVGYLGLERVTSERQFGAYTLGLAARVSFAVFDSPALDLSLGVEPTADVAAALGNDGASQDGAAPMLGGRAFLELTALPLRR